jgi:uncharacterized membrane protein (UPF0127 family)
MSFRNLDPKVPRVWVTFTSVANRPKVKAEIANTFSLREKGLGGRSSLPQGEGMLFDFPSEGFHSLWMKDVDFPLEGVFFNRGKVVVGVVSLRPRDLTPRSAYAPSRWILEVPAGWCGRNGVATGAQASWPEGLVEA